MLVEYKWDDIVAIDDPDEMWDRVIGVIKACLDAICPVKTLVLPLYTPEWLTPAIIEQMQTRDSLYVTAKRTGKR